jgi:hypothetical protein
LRILRFLRSEASTDLLSSVDTKHRSPLSVAFKAGSREVAGVLMKFGAGLEGFKPDDITSGYLKDVKKEDMFEIMKMKGNDDGFINPYKLSDLA